MAGGAGRDKGAAAGRERLAVIAIAAAAALLALAFFIPGRGEGRAAARGEPVPDYAWQAAGGRLDLNAAGEKELEALPGVGPVRARAILEYRVRCGPFESEYELLAVPGLPAAVALEFIDFVCVEGTDENTGS